MTVFSISDISLSWNVLYLKLIELLLIPLNYYLHYIYIYIYSYPIVFRLPIYIYIFFFSYPIVFRLPILLYPDTVWLAHVSWSTLPVSVSTELRTPYQLGGGWTTQCARVSKSPCSCLLLSQLKSLLVSAEEAHYC